jgi:hypothetical protein
VRDAADARRIAAATEILEQQRVIQFPRLLGGQADPLSDMHADPAAAHPMAGRLTFGQVARNSSQR